jgi:hypothetical protein
VYCVKIVDLHICICLILNFPQVPFKTAWPSYVSQSRVIFELTLPKSIGLVTSINAGIAELICAFREARHPIVAVTTDLQTGAHVFFVKDSCLTQVLHVSPLDALRFTAAFLLACSPSPNFRLPCLPASHSIATTAGPLNFFDELLQAMQSVDVSHAQTSLQAQLEDLQFLPSDERFHLTYHIIRSWNESHAAKY